MIQEQKGRGIMGCWNLYFTYLVFFTLVTYTVSETDIKPRFKGTKAAIKKELQALFNGEGALSDFVFYSKEAMEHYTSLKGPPRNRTELRRKTRPTAKSRTVTETTLAKALNQYTRGVNVEEITVAVKRLERIVLTSRRRKKNKKIRTKKTRSQYRRRRKSNYNRLDLRSKDSSHNEPGYNDFKNHINGYKEEVYDFDRMRRSASFTYTGTFTCESEGSAGTTTDTVNLCAVCYNTIDFGTDVIPQYANSVECSNTETNCLSGDGTCTQKVVYYTFQKFVTVDYYEAFEQALNTSCECRCITGSMIHSYFVGNSN